MREVEAPPLSRPIDQFAREVKGRASRFGRRKLQIAAATALGLVVTGVGLSVGFGGGQSGVHATATGTSATTSPAAGLPAPFAPNAAGSDENRAPAARQPSTSLEAPAPGNSAQGTSNGAATASLIDPANGGTVTVAPGAQVVVTLTPPAKGRWGTAHTYKDRESAISVTDQTTDQRGGVHFTLKGIAAGTAHAEVPCIGYRAGSWRSTISVS